MGTITLGSKDRFVFLVILINMISLNFAYSELKPDRIYTADTKKSKTFVRDGLIIGGDRAIDEITVKDIRRAKNSECAPNIGKLIIMRS